MKLIQTGPKNAKIVICGEAPGATEQATGVPFSGGSGDLLNRMLSHCGLSRHDCFITNLCHVQPPGNDFAWFTKPKVRVELAMGLMQLKKDIEEIKPNLVIALGAQPLRYLTNKVGIDKWRGSILESTLVAGTKVIATYHPAYILRIWDYKAVAELDLRRCKEESTTPVISYPQRELILNPPRERLGLLVDELCKAEWLAEDIECFETPTGWKLACVGFSDHSGRAVVIPCDHDWQLAAIKQISESPVRKVFQNGTFDCTVLRSNGINVVNFAWDTMLAHHSLFPECASGGDEMAALGGKKRQSAIAKGLAFLTSIYTKQPFYKDDGKLWRESNDLQMFWSYNGLDCCTTREIRDRQEEDLREFGTEAVFQHEMSLVQPLMDCTDRGIRVNTNRVKELKDGIQTEINNLQNFLDSQAGSPVNVKSSVQVQSLLYERLGLPAKRNRKTGNPTTDKDAIVELAGKYNHPVLATIIEIRQRRDLVERYLEARVDADSRMRCSFDITGTRSGRLSCRQSIYGSGTNLQTIPPELREIFCADEGKVLIVRDYKQAEAVLVAHLARARGLIELFDDPSRDVHKENASRIFGKSLGDVTSTERYLAKRVVHACNYGMEADRLVQVVNEDAKITGIRIDRKSAVSLIARYFMLYPQIREIFWREVENELRHSRTLNTPFGRKRVFFGRWDEKLLREAYSYIPQSTVGDLGAKAIVACSQGLEPRIEGLQTLLNVHDSVLVQCFRDDVERVAAEMERAMAIPITVGDRTFTIPTDCKVGSNWGDRPRTNPESNPGGLITLDQWLKENSNVSSQA